MNFNQEHWCRQQFAMMAEGGVWGVPRSGLLFKKEAGKLVLIDAMPHVAEMPVSEVELRELQENDYQAIKQNFELAGIPVRKK